jgi:MFS family permease
MERRSEDAASDGTVPYSDSPLGSAPPESPGARAGAGQGIYYGWVILLGGFLVLYWFYGIQFSFGLFLPDIEASLAPGQRALITLAFTIQASIYGFASVVTGLATDRWGPRPVFLAGALLIAAGLLWMSQARSLWELYLSYGLAGGLAMGTTWVPITSTAVKWFVARRGTALGLVASGIAVGQLTVPPFAGAVLVPLGWRTAYLVYGLVLFVVFALVALFMERDPESKGLLPDAGRQATHAGFVETEENFTLQEAARSSAMWLVTVTLTLVWSVVYLPSIHLPPFLRDELGGSAQLGSLTLSAIAVGSILARTVGGPLSDRTGHQRTMLVAIAVQALAFAIMALSAFLASLPLAYLGALVYGLSYGTITVLQSVVLADLFGRRYASSIAGVVFAISGTFLGVGVFIAGLLYQLTGGYGGAFLLGSIISLLAVPCFALVRKPQRRQAAALG